MSVIQVIPGVRTATRWLGRGVVAGLLVLALAVAVVSFLTACKCDDVFVIGDRTPEKPTNPQPTTPDVAPRELPIPPPANLKDN